MSENAQETKQSAQQKLSELLGFDSTKSASGSGVLQEALAEIQGERAKANKAKALELIKKALEISEKMEESKRQFQKAISSSEKELSQLIASIEKLG